jgi:hypothetical protein
MRIACTSNFMATNAAPEPSGPSLPTAPSLVAATSAPDASEPPLKLSAVLRHVVEVFAQRPVTLRELIVVLQGRAYTLLMLLLALPFLLPMPVPGLSSVLGTVIAVIALRLTLGQKPWLPNRLLDRELPPKFFPALLSGASRVLRFLEVMLKPCQLWLTASPLLLQLHAFIILVAAFVLLLPLPPGTNFPPALCIVIMASGLLERDGRFILGGYLAFALNVVFFALFAIYGQRLIQWVMHVIGA